MVCDTSLQGFQSEDFSLFILMSLFFVQTNIRQFRVDPIIYDKLRFEQTISQSHILLTTSWTFLFAFFTLF